MEVSNSILLINMEDLSLNVDRHFAYFSNLLSLIPLPKLHDNFDSDSETEKCGNKRDRLKPSVEGSNTNEIVKLPPAMLWQKYQSRLSELKGLIATNTGPMYVLKVQENKPQIQQNKQTNKQ